MSLTNAQIEDLAKKMKIPLVFCDYKDMLLTETPQINKYYIINLEDEFDSNGNKNPGSHWVSISTRQDARERPQYFYFDSYGCQAPKSVQEFVKMEQIPYNKKDIQGLLSSNCGYFCLALGHYLYSYEHRTGDLYTDADNFLDLFQNMNNNMDFYLSLIHI